MMARHIHVATQFFTQSKGRILQTILGVCVLTVCSSAQVMAQAPKPPAKAGPVPQSSVPPLAKPILKSGSQGDAVTQVQAMLKLMSFYAGPVNGIYDEATAAAVTQFQKTANLAPDGVVGAETWNRLLPSAPIAATPPNPQPAPPGTSTADSFPKPGAAPAPSTPPPQPAPTPKPTTVATGTPTGGDRPTAQDPATFPILRLGMKGPAVEGLQYRLQKLGFLKGAIDGVFGPETQAAVKAAQQQLKLEPDGIVGNTTWQGLLR